MAILTLEQLQEAVRTHPLYETEIKLGVDPKAALAIDFFRRDQVAMKSKKTVGYATCYAQGAALYLDFDDEGRVISIEIA